MNSSYFRFFKSIGFVPSHYVSIINLNIASFFIILENLIVAQLDVLLV